MLITVIIIVSQAKAFEYEWVKIEKRSHPSTSSAHNKYIILFL